MEKPMHVYDHVNRFIIFYMRLFSHPYQPSAFPHQYANIEAQLSVGGQVKTDLSLGLE